MVNKNLKKTSKGLSVKASEVVQDFTVAEIAETLNAVILSTSDLYEVNAYSKDMVSIGDDAVVILGSVEEHFEKIKKELSIIRYIDNLPAETETVKDTSGIGSVLGDFLGSLGVEVKASDVENVNAFGHKVGAKASDVVTSVKNIDIESSKKKAAAAADKVKGYVKAPDEIVDDAIALGLKLRKSKRDKKKNERD